MPKRLAITVAGAVSLGSYEAGVLYEITHAIGQHNQDPATSGAEKIFIDVLTGASAGGMTATIAAQKLLYEAGALQGPYVNCFYLPWVADVDLDGLLAMQGDDDPTKSVLSSQLVVDISRRYLTQRYQSHMDPPRDRHPACADRLYLGLALANLNGLDYGLQLRSGSPFIYTRFQDKLVTSFDPNDPTDDTLDFWDPLRNAAVSCGAFPFAFRVVDVIRHAIEYQDEKNLISKIAPTQAFTYTDGGTFQNEPIGLAKDLVDKIDNHLDVDNRFYLFVAPRAKGSTASSDFSASMADFRETAVQLVGAVYGQATFQDWITAEQVNQQVAVFNKRASELHAAFIGDAAVVNQRAQILQTAADQLLPALFPNAPAAAPGQPAPETKEQARSRLRKQFDADYNSLPAGVRDTWIDSILTLEKAANLSDRDEMTIFGITADTTELASTELWAFSGFFDRSYRDHDYDIGRRKAQNFLNDPGALGPIRYTAEPINPIDPALNGLKLEDMDHDVRTTVRDRLRDRAHEIMKEAGIDPFLVGGAVREAIDLAFIKPQLDKLLKL
jgi:hypothetical protein